MADLSYTEKKDGYLEKRRELNNLDKQISEEIELLKNRLEKMIKR